jgi:hypothetical protein
MTTYEGKICQRRRKFRINQSLMLSQKLIRWLSKKRQMQGAQLSRNEAYCDYAAVTRAIAATQQLVSFCDAINP